MQKVYVVRLDLEKDFHVLSNMKLIIPYFAEKYNVEPKVSLAAIYKGMKKSKSYRLELKKKYRSSQYILIEQCEVVNNQSFYKRNDNE